MLERRLTTIIGTGGMGKSELAREVGRWFVRRGLFPGGVTFIPLGLYNQATEARLRIAAALGLDPAAAETFTAAWPAPCRPEACLSWMS
ncbi:MAG: hypothetical protein AB1801_00275 [Chloroflexota bacterium]